MTDVSRLHVALVGLRCSGKSSVGREVARRLGRPFVDLDEEIARLFGQERESKKSEVKDRGLGWVPQVGEVLSQVGEREFRGLEERALRSALARQEASVIATGGGVVEGAANRQLLASTAEVVWLRVEIPELQRRLSSDPAPRPALKGGDPVAEIPALATRRGPLYREVSRIEIECGKLGAKEIAELVLSRLEGGASPGA